MTIRRILPRDYGATARLHKKIFAGIGQTEQDLHVTFASHEYTTFVCEYKTKIVGYGQVYLGKKGALFTWYGVSPSARNKGVGLAILKRAVTFSRRRKVKSLSLHTRNRFKKAMIQYLKFGFTINHTYEGRDGDTMIVMDMRL